MEVSASGRCPPPARVLPRGRQKPPRPKETHHHEQPRQRPLRRTHPGETQRSEISRRCAESRRRVSATRAPRTAVPGRGLPGPRRHEKGEGNQVTGTTKARIRAPLPRIRPAPASTCPSVAGSRESPPLPPPRRRVTGKERRG